MRVLRNGDVFLATRITGPSQNLLALDFSYGVAKYVKDLSESESPSVEQTDVVDQVHRALEEQGVDPDGLTGVQYNGQDTPSKEVYYEMAKVIIGHHLNDDQLDEFTPSWSPSDCESNESEE